MDAWGHTLSQLLAALPAPQRPGAPLIDRAKELDKHYIPTRSPNGFERGAPTELYTAREADQAIANAEAISRWGWTSSPSPETRSRHAPARRCSMP